LDKDKYKELLLKLENMDGTLERLRHKLDELPEEEQEAHLSDEEKKMKKFLDSSFW
jgi:hypothetical protein